MAVVATAAATAYLAASCRLVARRPFSGLMTMSSSSYSSAAANAAAARMRHLSSYSSTSSSDVNGNTSSSSSARPLHPPKRILLLRHGQALHNPRAEAARENGCDFDTFLSLMEEDDAFDAALTELGESQAVEAGGKAHVRSALRDVEMIVSSPLSRALRTADLVHPPTNASPKRVCIEDFREINGKLLNAQRRHRKELEERFPHWHFGHIPELDESWTEELECRDVCGRRGYQGLMWMMQQREQNILLVCHGGLLNYTMNGNSNIVLVDRRTTLNGEEKRCITKRFGNCEMREFVVTVWDSGDYSCEDEKDTSVSCKNGESILPVITLEEVTMMDKDSHYFNNDEIEESVRKRDAI